MTEAPVEDIDGILEERRIKTYVAGLDERMEGGVPAGYIVLLCGKAGTMKSSLAYNIVYNLAKNREGKGIYITLEQNRKSLIGHMTKLGMADSSIKDMVIKDLDDMVIIDMGKLRKETESTPNTEGINWVNSILTAIKNYKKMFGCDVLVLDSLAALYSLTEFKNPRSELFFFFEKLRDLDVTTFLISEILSKNDTFGVYEVEDFLADGIIHLDTDKDGKKVNLFLSVVKMRKTKHDRGYHPLIFDDDGFELVID